MNPVLRENLEVFFDERQILPVYFYLLIFLAPAAFVALYAQSLGETVWRGSGNLLKVCASVAVVLIVYFAARVANQEFAQDRFRKLEQWLRDGTRAIDVVARGRVSFLLVHVACLTLLSAPVLVWGAAISRIPLSALAATLALIPFYAFCYGVWGLVASAIWEPERETREFIVRCFVLVVVVAALAIYLPLNPVIYLLAVIGGEEPAPFRIAGVSGSADTLHFAFHIVLGGLGLITHRWALKRALALGRR